eukprot:3941570-Rhodomonas_salina.3
MVAIGAGQAGRSTGIEDERDVLGLEHLGVDADGGLDASRGQRAQHRDPVLRVLPTRGSDPARFN